MERARRRERRRERDGESKDIGGDTEGWREWETGGKEWET